MRMIHIIHCYSKHIYWVDFWANSAACFCRTKFKQNCECESVRLMQNVSQDSEQKLVISTRFEFQCRQRSFYFLICNHRMDCPLWSWHSLTQRERERKKGRMKGPLMKGLNPAPHSHFSLPPSLPCPVELIWQRGGSISQFTQAACSFFCAVPSSSLASPVSPPPIHLAVLCGYASLPMFVCTATVLFCKQWAVE